MVENFQKIAIIGEQGSLLNNFHEESIVIGIKKVAFN